MPKFTTAIIAAVATIAVSGPAFAAGKTDAKVVQRNGQTFYCVKEQTTGSRLPDTTCLTKEQWEARGSKVASAKDQPVLASNAPVHNQN